MRLKCCKIYVSQPSNHLEKLSGIGLICIVSVLTNSGGFVLSGAKVTLIKSRLLIIMGRFISKERLPSIHPGEILLEEFLKPLELSQYRLAKEINVQPDGSMKSFWASERLLRIRHYGYHAILDYQSGFG